MTGPDYDPIRLEIFKHLFAAIPEEMGAVLQKSSYSPNIKERRDFSCAIFDPEGRMIAQAAHIPVHLGAMPLSVGQAIQSLPLDEGDVMILNDPYRGAPTCRISPLSRRFTWRAAGLVIQPIAPIILM
ncbi:MAG: hydantoinase B/oxoprolinase family protein, partial [Anaerolineales bacterium]|nr:hydantoinase B/oxoprolinase family protein [Anaerolineales bacterium]